MKDVKVNTKLILSGVLAVMLAGCTTVPQAPKDTKEMAEMGEDNLLNVPVDITGFTAAKMEIIAEDGNKGRITTFVNPATGKVYDLDGQVLNDKGERILRDGHVCKVKTISLSNARHYVGGSFWTGEDKWQRACRTIAVGEIQQQHQAIMVGGALLGPAGLVGALGVNGTRLAVQSLTDGDTK
jgi:hypothetical protein